MKKFNAERIKKLKDEINIPQQFCGFDVVFFSVAFALVFLFFGHPDLWETANHSYVLLESVFDGDFLGFYETVAAHDNSYYYINNANYNIVIYIIFALWELPIFVFNRLFGLALNEYFIWQWAKVVSTGFYVACGFMLKKLCRDLGFDSGKAFMAAMFFIFNPVAMFSPVVMGQYDSICLLFVLWALRYYLKDDLTKFSLVIGVGVVCKFYALLIFVPLLLLAEKRLVKILQHGITSLWLYIPTTLLFWGRTGDANQFTLQMINRLIATEMPGGMKPLPIFVVFYMLIVFAAYLYVPKSSKNKAGMALWLCLAVFGVLFASIVWHPQWLVLIVPFMVVTTFMQKNKTPWLILDIAFAAGFFYFCFFNFGSQMGAILFDGGIMYDLSGIMVASLKDKIIFRNFVETIPFVQQVFPSMFTAAIMANIIFKLPVGEMFLADKLSAGAQENTAKDKVWLYAVFAFGLVLCWLVPTVLELLENLNIINIY